MRAILARCSHAFRDMSIPVHVEYKFDWLCIVCCILVQGGEDFCRDEDLHGMTCARRSQFWQVCILTLCFLACRYKGAKIVVRNGERVIEWTEMEPVVVMHGDLRGKEKVLVRVHDQCFTSEVLGSKRCDCKEQLDMAMLHILQNEGAVIYMPQEGRGIGLANKIAAYELQDGGLDTVDANRHLGFEDDERSYSCVPFILQDMGIESVQLITNNPYKIHHLKDSGVKIDSVTPSIVVPNMHNLKYLRTKAERMAHLLSLDMLQVHQTKPAEPLGPQTLEKAVQALREGGIAMLLRGQGASAEAALVVRADLASGESVSDMSRLSDGFVSTVVTPERWRQLGLGEGGGDDEGPISADAADMIAKRERLHTFFLRLFCVPRQQYFLGEFTSYVPLLVLLAHCTRFLCVVHVSRITHCPLSEIHAAS